MVNEFDVSNYDKRTKIVILGAGSFGEYTFRALQNNGIKPVCFCDRKKNGRLFFDLPVVDYDYLSSPEAKIILIAIGAAYYESEEIIKKYPHHFFYSIRKLVFKDGNLEPALFSGELKNLAYFEKLYVFGQRFQKEKKELKLFHLDWIITEKCSFRCKDCANLMQYYKNPINFSINDLWTGMDRFLSLVDEILDVRVLGGEPFMNPQMAKIIERYLNNSKIGLFTIYTNASIQPNAEMLRLLQSERVRCEISDYGEISKNLDSFIKTLKENGVCYHVVKPTYWLSLGKLENRGYNDFERQQVFANCQCRDLYSLVGKELFRCPVSAHGRRLEAIPYNENEVIDLFDQDAEVKRKIRDMIYTACSDDACGYCSGRNDQTERVAPAIQTKVPLEYKKRR